MTTPSYRIESFYPIVGPLITGLNNTALHIADRAMAIVMAAKSETRPYGKEIRVVHQPSGDIVYRKAAGDIDPAVED